MEADFRKFSRWVLVAAACLLLTAPAYAASAGHLNGIVKDDQGNPLSNLLVALIARSGDETTIPILTRTDKTGRLIFKNIQAGTYQLLVRSSAYQSPAGRFVQISPGQTVSVSLVLQQLLSLGPGEQNVGLKTLLRANGADRLIFRTRPDLVEDGPRFFEKAAVEVYSNAWGAGGPFSPLRSPGGTTTNFAVKQSMIGGNDYVVAGQFNSGPDSFWRVKNQLDYQLGDGHSLQLFMGYGRLSVDQPDNPSINNPVGVRDESGFSSPVSATRVMSLGLEDTLQFGDALSLVWGMELNQVRRADNRYFVSPNAEINFEPVAGTQFRALMASKRETRGNSVTLPDEESVNLADAVQLSFIGDRVLTGTARLYEASIAQDLGDNTTLQLAAYWTRLTEVAVPYFSVDSERTPQAFHLNRGQAANHGYRLTVERQLGDKVRASFSYVRADAVGIDQGVPALLVDRADLGNLLRRRGFHALATEVEAYLPASQTHLTAIVKRVTHGRPLVGLDPLSDVYETSNQGVNLFVRQLIPVPTSVLNFLGLDFLASYKIEALLDIRNLTNDDLGLLQTAEGDVLLVENPRTVRGGIALNF